MADAMEPAGTAWEALRGASRPTLLFTSHGHGGGIARHVAELASALEACADVVLLHPAAHGKLALRRLGEPDASLWFDADEWPQLVSFLRALRIARIHYHHVDGLPQAVLELPRALACPYDVTLHDFFPACPDYHFTGPGRFCGGEPGCLRCAETRPAQWPVDIAQWRETFRAWLRDAGRVIAPSLDTAGRIRRFFPGIAPLVWPHPERSVAMPAYTRVLVPGALSAAKGLDLLEACARDARERGLPLFFRVAGFVSRPLAPWPQAPLSISGEYPEGMLPELLAIESGHAALFLSQCPETWSYTLSAAISAGLPVVAMDLGAMAERLAGRENARVLPWEAGPRAVNEALLEVAPPRPAVAAPEAGTADAYVRRYAEVLGTRAAPPAQDPPLAIQPRWCERPETTPPDTSLAWLYEDGVVCGRAESRRRLLESAVQVEQKLNAAMGRLAEAWALIDEQSAAAGRLEGELEAQRGRIGALAGEAAHARARLAAAEAELAALRGSLSWRITRPLRAVRSKLRSR